MVWYCARHCNGEVLGGGNGDGDGSFVVHIKKVAQGSVVRTHVRGQYAGIAAPWLIVTSADSSCTVACLRGPV